MLIVIGDLVADLIVLGGSALERGTDNPAQVRLTRGGSAANVAVAASPRHPVRFNPGKRFLPSVQWPSNCGSIATRLPKPTRNWRRKE